MDIGGFIGTLVASPFICIGWIIAGAIAGGVAHSIMRSNAPLITDIIVGLIGAVIGGFLVGLLGIGRAEDGLTGYIVSILVAIVGAVVLLGILRVLRGQRFIP